MHTLMTVPFPLDGSTYLSVSDEHPVVATTPPVGAEAKTTRSLIVTHAISVGRSRTSSNAMSWRNASATWWSVCRRKATRMSSTGRLSEKNKKFALELFQLYWPLAGYPALLGPLPLYFSLPIRYSFLPSLPRITRLRPEYLQCNNRRG